MSHYFTFLSAYFQSGTLILVTDIKCGEVYDEKDSGISDRTYDERDLYLCIFPGVCG